MLGVLLVTVLFVIISVYFYLRAEKLQVALHKVKREMISVEKDNTKLTKSIVMLAGNHESFVKNRYELLIDNIEQTDKANAELLEPLINNYAVIFRECIVGKGKMQMMIKKCYENQVTHPFNDFTSNIIKTDPKIQRLWGSNNLAGFTSLVEALLTKYQVDIKKEKS